MKRFYYNILLAIFPLVAIMSAGCDQIEQPYTEKGEIITTTNKKILIEDFTGHRCQTCPAAHETGKSIQDLYQGKVILLSVHYGELSKPLSPDYPYNFRISAGNDLGKAFNIQATPKGVISRTTNPQGNKIYDPGSWASTVQTLLSQDAWIELGVEPSYDSQTRRISVTVKAKYLKSEGAGDWLSVYIAEDSIVKPQLVEETRVENYVHNNVLRGVMNGTWGDKLQDADVVAGTTVTKEYTYTIPSDSDWRPDKLKIIAFIHDNEGTKEIYQVESAPLIK